MFAKSRSPLGVTGLSALLLIVVASLSQAQTPPIKLNTPDVKVPPPLTLPGPSKVEIGAQPLTVAEAVAIALSKQPQVGIARANVLTAQGRTQQASSALFPQFSAGAGYADQRTLRSPSGTSSSGVVPNRFSADVGVQQLLFDFGRTRDQVRQQNALEKATLWLLKRTQETVVLQVKLAFYDLVQTRATVGITEGDVTNRQRELDQAQARADTGLGPPSDVVQAKTNMANAAIGLSLARNAALAAQITLDQLLAIDSRTPITPASAKEAPVTDESDLQNMVTTALNNRADILAAQQDVQAAHFAVSVARKNNLPRVDLTAGVNGRGPNDPFPTQAATIGVNVNWTFGDGGLTAGLIKEALGAQEVARQNLIGATNQAVTDVSLAYVDLESALERVTLGEVGVANAQELVVVSEGRYTGGIGLFLDVTNAQNSLYTAQRSLIQAQEDVDRARVRLRAAVGTQ